MQNSAHHRIGSIGRSIRMMKRSSAPRLDQPPEKKGRRERPPQSSPGGWLRQGRSVGLTARRQSERERDVARRDWDAVVEHLEDIAPLSEPVGGGAVGGLNTP